MKTGPRSAGPGRLSPRTVALVALAAIVTGALLSVGFRVALQSSLELSEAASNLSVGKVYADSQRVPILDWLTSPGPPVRRLAGAEASGAAGPARSDGDGGAHGYQLVLYRWQPHAAIGRDAPGAVTPDKLPAEVRMAAQSGEAVTVRSPEGEGSGDTLGTGGPMPGIRSYLPILTASGQAAGVLEIVSDMRTTADRIAEQQAVFFAAVSLVLFLVAFLLAMATPSGGFRRLLRDPASERPPGVAEPDAVAPPTSSVRALPPGGTAPTTDSYQWIDNLDAPAIAIDTDHRLIHANAAARELTGHTLENGAAPLCYQWLRNRDQPCGMHAEECPLETGRQCRSCFESDKGCATEIVALPLKDETGRITGAIDIAQQTKSEKGSAQTDSSGRPVAAPSSPYEIRSELMAKFSHEIRTPLNTVLGMADLLRLTTLTRKQRTYIHTIQSSGEMLLSLIDNVLDFSKLESRNLTLQEREFDVQQLLQDVLDIMGYFAYSKDVELIGRIEGRQDLRILSDKRRLKQILVNLVGNAIKFTEAGEIEVVIDSRQVDDMTYRLDVWVKDSGCGVDPSLRARVFQSFVSSSQRELERPLINNGLGLAICKSLIENMRGEIELVDRKSGGTTAHFSIPVRRVRQSDPEAYGRPPSFPDRVLIAHGNREAALSLRAQLQAWQVECDIAQQPEELIARVDAAWDDQPAYDAIIMDTRLADDDDRLALARELRASDHAGNIPLLLLVPITESLEVGEVSALGPVRCLNKPVLPLELRAQLNSLFVQDLQNFVPEPDDLMMHFKAPMRILIAEDNPVNALMLLNMLRTEGHDADLVNNGLSVLKKVRARKYDLVLMDCQMPGMDGDEVTREIRSNARQYFVPELIVAITADTTERQRDRCMDAGMDDFLVKPIRLDKLRKGLARWSVSIAEVKGATNERPSSDDVSTYLTDRLGISDDGLLTSYIGLFLDDADMRLRSISVAVDEGDYEQVNRESHALKGSCMEFGAERMSRLCRDISVAARDCDSATLSVLVERLEKEYSRLRPVYETALSE